MTDAAPLRRAESIPPGKPPLVLGPKPVGADYGYVEKQAHASTREELVERLAEGRPTPLVWTPETEGIVPPWTVPYLFDAYRAHGLRHARKVALVWGAVSFAALAWAAVLGTFDFRNGLVLFGFIAAVVSFYSALEWGRYRRLSPDQLTYQVREARARPPARTGPARWTQLLAGAIGAVVLVQSLGAIFAPSHGAFPVMPGNPAIGASVMAAGMVKVAVAHGEPWRLLSGAFLHDGLLHFGMNTMALLALGRFVEAYSHRAYVPIVFLLTALAASGASFAFSHADASVGASGGVMGIFGFLALMARRRREVMPPGFGKAILIDIGVIAAMGIFGRGYIDNWAHAGGFVAGALLGWLMIPHGGRTAYWEPSRPIRLLGDVSLAILLLASLGTVGVLIARLFPNLV
ncbi:MAG TPA: rhomboid family intramembrane serine protease [Longimicrobium sp.]|nr:rhomboid family intramembrane serine protease [Longimicrobium sp.]